MSVTGRDRPRTPHSGVSWGPRCLLSADESHGRQVSQTPRCRANSSGFSDPLSPQHSGTQGPWSFPGFTDCPHKPPRHSGATPFSERLARSSASSGLQLLPSPRPLPSATPMCPLFFPPPSVQGLHRWFNSASSVYTFCRKLGNKTVAKHSSKLTSCHLSEPRPGPLEWDFYTPNYVDGTQGTRGGALGPGTWQLSPLPAAGPRPPAPAVT